MKTEEKHIDQIIAAFNKMQDKHDLLDLLNFAKPYIYGKDTVPFELKQLTWHANPKLGKSRYTTFQIKKKSGSVREINAPNRGLKSIQKTLNYILQCVFIPHKASMGFTRDKSIVDNAKIHEGNNYVYNIDIKDFFTSIDQARVWKCLQLKPFNLSNNNLNNSWLEFKKEFQLDIDINELLVEKIYQCPSFIISIDDNFDIDKEAYLRKNNFLKKNLNDFDMYLLTNEKYNNSRIEIANIIANICCTEIEVERINANGESIKLKKNVLPQGAPTSPILSNIICQRLDYLLSGVAKRFGLRYSRYADDITFSSMHNVYQNDSEFINEINRIISEQGFQLNKAKTRLQKDGYRKEVTGLLVNDKTNVQKRYIKEIRMWLYYWERYGYEKASYYFSQKYINKKYNSAPDFKSVIIGKVNYLSMVKGKDNGLYIDLNERINLLFKKESNKLFDDLVKKYVKKHKIELPEKEHNHSHLTNLHFKNEDNKIRVKIESSTPIQRPTKLKRRIIINEGELLPINEIIENFNSNEKEIDLSKHKPIDVSRFLMNFRSSNGLKYLTHDYDLPGSFYDYDYILMIAKKEFDDLTKKYIIPRNLWARIYQYAFGETNKTWQSNKINYKINWKSEELIKWIDLNPNTHPIKNSDFEINLIKPFKKSIEIKSPDLVNIFNNKLAENFGQNYTSYEIELIDLDKANFYTNVDALQSGISYIFKAINQRFQNSNKIKIEFTRKSDDKFRKRIIKIIHIDSICDKPLDKKELFQGDLLEAEKALFGICDWSIISKSTVSTNNKLNILFDIHSNIKPKEMIDESSIEGFTHILTFYS